MRSRLRRATTIVVAALTAAAAFLLVAGTAAAYTTSPQYTATDFATGFQSTGANGVGPVGLAWDSTNHLYVMDYATGILYRFDSSGGVADAAHQVTVGSSPWGSGNAAGIAFSKSGRLYVAVQGWSRVDEVNLANGQVVRTLGYAHCATGIATDPTNGDLLASDPCGYNAMRIQNPDSATPGLVYGQLPVWADGVTFAPDGSIWSTYAGNTLVHVDAAGSHYITGISTLDGTAVSSAGDGSVFANTNNGRVVKYDPSTGAQTVIYSGGSRGDFSTVGPDGCLYITQTDRVVKITNADGTCSWSPTTALPLLDVAPASQSLTAGSSATLTATLKNVAHPDGTTVTFTVTGANPQTLTASADSSGVATVSYVGTHVGTDHVSASAVAGSVTVNSATTSDVTWTDSTPPVIVPTIGGTLGSNGWYVSPVTISFAVSDPESGVASTSGCDTVTVSTDTSSYSVTCTATNGAGLTSSDTETVKVDQTPPTVAFSPNGGVYDVDQTVAIACSATDATSGVASTTCTDVNAPAWSFTAGTHSLSATATDNAGNVGSGSGSFTVAPTAGGTCDLATQWSSNAGLASSLCAKLRAAAASRARGQNAAADGQLRAFRNEVTAQSGKAISAANADTLIRLSYSL